MSINKNLNQMPKTKKKKTKVPFTFNFFDDELKTEFNKRANASCMSMGQRLNYLISEDLKQQQKVA